MKSLLKRPHIILNVDNGRYPAKRKISHRVAMAALGKIGGGQVVELKGHYGTPETSILISNPSDRQAEFARKLAHETGQESHIESDGHSHKMYFNHGDQAGTIVHGTGTNFHTETPKDNFSVLPDGTIFTHNFNFEQSAPHPHGYDWHDGDTSHHDGSGEFDKAEPTHPHLQAHGPTGNEQAGGNTSGEFHNVMGHFGTITPGKKSNLKFYHGIDQFHDKIDDHIKQSGHQVYMAGGQHGKPDLANKNYNTKHLMIYDPKEGSGGDFGNEQFTSAWRKIHEKAHADTLPEINQKYGEGRRLGKLGVRTPREMKRAVEWEHLAAHKQRQLMEQMGHKISDEDFAKEYNTVIGDAVHRAVTGQFTDPHEMGFEPHNKPVNLSVALGMIDNHAAKLGLRHDDDTTMKLRADRGMTKAEPENEHPVDAMFREWGNDPKKGTFHTGHIRRAVDTAQEEKKPLSSQHIHKIMDWTKNNNDAHHGLQENLVKEPAFGKEHIDKMMDHMKIGNSSTTNDVYAHSIRDDENLHNKMTSEQANRFLKEQPNDLATRSNYKFFDKFGDKISKETLDDVMPSLSRINYSNGDSLHQSVVNLPNFDESHLEQYESNNPSYVYDSKFMTPEKLHDHLDRDPAGVFSSLDTVLNSPKSVVNSGHLDKMVDRLADTDLNFSTRSKIMGEIVKHPEFNQDTVRKLWRDQHTNVTDTLRGSLVDKLPRAKNLPEDIMEEMLDSKEGNAAEQVAKRPDLPSNLREKAFKHENPSVRAAVIKNRQIPSELLTRALKDPSAQVRSEALEHDTITPEHVKAAFDNPNLEGITHGGETGNVEHEKKAYQKHLNDKAREHGIYEDPDKVEFSLGTGKVRQLADMAEKAGGKIHKKDAEKAGLNPQNLRVQHLQDAQGNLDATKLREHIGQQPKLKYGWSERKYGTEDKSYEDALDEHSDTFDPEDYGVYKRDHVDTDKAFEDHISNFKPEDYDINEEDFKDEEGNPDKDAYEQAYEKAQEEHSGNFDPDDYADNDEFINQREYDKALESASEQHNERFDPNDYGAANSDDSRSDDAESQQRHSNEQSKVFQLNITQDQIKKLKDAGVYDHFKELNDDSYSSGHPASKGNGIGWVRYTDAPDGTHVDEIQSDFGQSFSKQLKAQAKQAVADGTMSEAAAQKAIEDGENKYPEDAHQKIADILFQGQHPNDILHEAFLQHLRDKGQAGKQVHIWQAKAKAPLSNMSDRDLPVHMLRTYQDIPKKMGYKPASYGDISTQKTGDLNGEPTWAQTLVKKEHRMNLLKAFVEMEKSKNVREQRRKIFGTDPNAPRISDKRMKMMNQIRQYAKEKYGMDLNIASGKRDASGKLREKPDLAHEPFDVYTKQGHAAEKIRNAKLKETGEKRTDPKPDWRSGNLETQPSPDAAVHELSHLDLAPEGKTPAEWQTDMDAAYARHGKEFGHAQGKRTSWEVQPMSIENPIRRELGLPANRTTKTPLTPEEVAAFNQGKTRRAKGLPNLQVDPKTGVELTWDDKNPRFVAGKDAKGNPAYYDRQSRLSTPETKQRVQDIRTGTLKFHPEKGWYRAADANALVNLRGQGRTEEANRRAAEKFGKPQEDEEKMAASEDLMKMSRARLRFPSLPGIPSRPDADVRLLETGRQKDIYGKVVANQAIQDAIKDPKSQYTPDQYRASAPKIATSVAGRFDRRTLGTSVPTKDPKGKTFDASLAGKLRTKFEEPSPGYKEGAVDNYHKEVEAHNAKSKELRDRHQSAKTLLEQDAIVHEFERHKANKPKKPRRQSVKAKATGDLPPEQMAARGRGVESTIEHEATHSIFRKLGAQYGKDFEQKARKHILDSFPKEAIGAIHAYVRSVGYKAKDPYLEEEIVTHARDLLVNPKKREKFKQLIGDKADDRIKEIKAGWQEAVKRAKNIKPDSFKE